MLESLREKLLLALRMLELYTMPPKITKLANLIKDYEGGPGDRNFRNLNPGNCRFHHGGYLKKYGKVLEDKDGFAIFSSYDVGFAYLCNMLLNWAKTSRKDWTIHQLMASYAPNSDGNDPVNYAKYLTARLGVDSGTLLGELL